MTVPSVNDDLARVRDALEGVGAWAASISEPSDAIENGVREASAALSRVNAELERLREERDGWKCTSRHYESLAANAGLL